MAFTEETGSGVAGANAYISVAFADTYHADRGHSAWDSDGTNSITTAQKEAAIIRATDHIDRIFGLRFKGDKETDAQGLLWPRTGAYDEQDFALIGVPAQLQKACAEYALRALLYGVLTPDGVPRTARQAFTSGESLPEYNEGGDGQVTLYRDKVGPLETEVRYASGSGGELPAHPGADYYLSFLLRPRQRSIIRG